MAKKEKAPSFLFYAKDWSDYKVRRMGFAAQGVYIRLLGHMWTDSPDHCSVENNPEVIRHALGYIDRDWQKVWEEIMWSGDPLLIEDDSGRLVSKRLRKEAEKRSSYRASQRQKAGIRWGVPEVMPNGCRTDATASEKGMPKVSRGITPASAGGMPNGFKKDAEGLKKTCPRVENENEDENTLKNLERRVDEAKSLWGFWNTLGVIEERGLLPGLLGVFLTALERYSPVEINDAMANYAKILNSADYTFTTRWTLWDFLAKQNALPKFLTSSRPFESYPKTKSNGAGPVKPTSKKFTLAATEGRPE